uniref:Uncharacterized protein n=1 Tax=Micrurus carvalhoi TaxID=3147026 RepID=A0A2H6NAF5_9SAUR
MPKSASLRSLLLSLLSNQRLVDVRNYACRESKGRGDRARVTSRVKILINTYTIPSMSPLLHSPIPTSHFQATAILLIAPFNQCFNLKGFSWKRKMSFYCLEDPEQVKSRSA